MKICSKVFFTVAVPAPDEPVIEITGCIFWTYRGPEVGHQSKVCRGRYPAEPCMELARFGACQ